MKSLFNHEYAPRALVTTLFTLIPTFVLFTLLFWNVQGLSDEETGFIDIISGAWSLTAFFSILVSAPSYFIAGFFIKDAQRAKVVRVTSLFLVIFSVVSYLLLFFVIL